MKTNRLQQEKTIRYLRVYFDGKCHSRSTINTCLTMWQCICSRISFHFILRQSNNVVMRYLHSAILQYAAIIWIGNRKIHTSRITIWKLVNCSKKEPSDICRFISTVKCHSESTSICTWPMWPWIWSRISLHFILRNRTMLLYLHNIYIRLYSNMELSYERKQCHIICETGRLEYWNKLWLLLSKIRQNLGKISAKYRLYLRYKMNEGNFVIDSPIHNAIMETNRFDFLLEQQDGTRTITNRLTQYYLEASQQQWAFIHLLYLIKHLCFLMAVQKEAGVIRLRYDG